MSRIPHKWFSVPILFNSCVRQFVMMSNNFVSIIWYCLLLLFIFIFVQYKLSQKDPFYLLFNWMKEREKSKIDLQWNVITIVLFFIMVCFLITFSVHCLCVFGMVQVTKLFDILTLWFFIKVQSHSTEIILCNLLCEKCH